MNVSAFIKNHIPLCVFTLGIAVVGYLGYHAVFWIVNKCQNTEKIDRVGQTHLNSKSEEKEQQLTSAEYARPLQARVSSGEFSESAIQIQQEEETFSGSNEADVSTETTDNEDTLHEESSDVEEESWEDLSESSETSSSTMLEESSICPKPRVNRISSLSIPKGKVRMGQGEYIVFHNLPSGEKKEVTEGIYDQVYQVLNDYAPASIIARNSQSAMDEYENRYERIQAKVKEIDATLEVVFVSRTLYELIFIRKCIQEDLKNNKICGQLKPFNWGSAKSIKDFDGDQQKFESFEVKRIKKIKEGKKCWHLCFFDHVGDNHHPGVRDVAFRLNRAITKTLLPPADGLSYDEHSLFVEKEIEYLKEYFQQKGRGLIHCGYSGPSNNFACESERGMIHSMPISEDKHAQIIRNAVALDCSKIAQRAFIMYRGANFDTDAAAHWSNKDKPFSLSFGSSLFAGSLYDGTATAFYYMRKASDAYAIPIPYDEVKSCLFFVPPTNTIAQLFCWGEFFHGRTKAWKGNGQQKIGGVAGVKYTPEQLKSELTKKELLIQFENYKNQAIQLK